MKTQSGTDILTIPVGDTKSGPSLQRDTSEDARPHRTKPIERLLVAGCGAISVLNVHEYVFAFREIASEIRLVLTRNAAELAATRSLSAILQGPIYCANDVGTLTVPHMQLAGWADTVVVVPATANVLGKAANGIADDLLTSVLIARPPGTIFVPDMNPVMWANPAVRRNVQTLTADGHRVLTRGRTERKFETATGEWVDSNLMPTPREVAEFLVTEVKSEPVDN